MMRWPPTGRRVPPPPAAERRDAGVDVHRAALREVAGQQIEQLLEVRVERAVRRLLDAEVLEDRHARRAREAARHLAHQRLGHARARGVVGDRNVASASRTVSKPVAWSRREVVIDEILLHEHGEERAQAERVGAGAHLQVDSRRARRSRCGADRSRSACAPDPAAISFSVTRARGKPCDCHGFLPTNTATSACSKSPVVWQRGRP